MNRPKELFEELGYSVDQDDEYCISYVNKKEDKEITFFYEDVKILMYSPSANSYYTPAIISMPLLQAIYRQCEDLEWI